MGKKNGQEHGNQIYCLGLRVQGYRGLVSILIISYKQAIY